MINKKIAIFIGLLALPMIGFSESTQNAPVLVTTYDSSNIQPNSYDLKGSNLQISYTTTGIDGKAHFSYKNAKDVLSFTGKEIRTVDTEIGTLVSVTTSMAVDTGSTSFSVLIPKVNLDKKLKFAIKTQGFLTQHKFSVIPSFNTGQLDNYKTYSLTGTARFVVF
ncbi:MAG: hypothetical protein PHN45_03135 [Methylococcales bacterium]|nr:hypothetical protein [Methylococcales bacterium]MDD5753727.1 hypothetical protein [Methylococcales bacterium]